jgi:hypothetical protein
MKIYLSVWGKHTNFRSMKAAIAVCLEKKLDRKNGKGLLWIQGESRKECDEWRKKNAKIINHEYMRIMYKGRGGRNWEWCSVYNKWDDWNNEDKLNSNE